MKEKRELGPWMRTDIFLESTFQLDNNLAAAFSLGQLLLAIECKRSRFQPGTLQYKGQKRITIKVPTSQKLFRCDTVRARSWPSAISQSRFKRPMRGTFDGPPRIITLAQQACMMWWWSVAPYMCAVELQGSMGDLTIWWSGIASSLTKRLEAEVNKSNNHVFMGSGTATSRIALSNDLDGIYNSKTRSPDAETKMIK